MEMEMIVMISAQCIGCLGDEHIGLFMGLGFPVTRNLAKLHLTGTRATWLPIFLICRA